MKKLQHVSWGRDRLIGLFNHRSGFNSGCRRRPGCPRDQIGEGSPVIAQHGGKCGGPLRGLHTGGEGSLITASVMHLC